MEYYFKHSAFSDLKKLSKETQRKIIKKLDYFTNSSKPLKFAIKLKDKTLGNFRFRIDVYRIFFDINYKNNNLIILKIGHRKDIYK